MALQCIVAFGFGGIVVSVINAIANIYVQKIQVRLRDEDRKEARIAWLREKRLIAFTALSEELIVLPREPEHIDLSKSYHAAAQVSNGHSSG